MIAELSGFWLYADYVLRAVAVIACVISAIIAWTKAGNANTYRREAAVSLGKITKAMERLGKRARLQMADSPKPLPATASLLARCFAAAIWFRSECCSISPESPLARLGPTAFSRIVLSKLSAIIVGAGLEPATSGA